MSVTDYLSYLESPEWWQLRRRALARTAYRCERCGGLGPLEAHHRTYDRLGDEALDDVEMLCRVCHVAERLPRNKRKRALERVGQGRLFDRWDDPDDGGGGAALPVAA